MRQGMMKRRGCRKRRSIVVYQRYCWVRNRGMVGWLQAIVVTPIKAAEGRMWAIKIWHSQGPTRGDRGLSRALIAGQRGRRRTRGRAREKRWRMVRGWSWRVNRGRMDTVGGRMWRSM